MRLQFIPAWVSGLGQSHLTAIAVHPKSQMKRTQVKAKRGQCAALPHPSPLPPCPAKRGCILPTPQHSTWKCACGVGVACRVFGNHMTVKLSMHGVWCRWFGKVEAGWLDMPSGPTGSHGLGLAASGRNRLRVGRSPWLGGLRGV